jgi:hypothetical protein
MRARAPGVLATRLATCSTLVCLLHNTTKKAPRYVDSAMAGSRNDAGLDAGTMMASKWLRRDLNGGGGVWDTSRDKCACDARCRTPRKCRLDAMPAALNYDRPGSVPTRTSAPSGFEDQVTSSGYSPPGLVVTGQTRHLETDQQGIFRSLLGLFCR